MTLALMQRIRARFQGLQCRYRGQYWFPQIPLAMLLVGGGLWLLHARFATTWYSIFHALLEGEFRLNPKLLPPLLIGSGMLTMGVALAWRSRLAWVVAVLLCITGFINTELTGRTHSYMQLAYFALTGLLLLLSWRRFDRSSLAASTVFAVTSMLMLLLYATFGSYYLGDQFRPPIHDLVTALYYATVTMTTVGYGDITAQTTESRLFTLSVIVLGVAVFATSLTAVIAPLLARTLQRVINRKGPNMKREHHFVVIGNTPLALNTWRELARRGRPVTRLLREAPEAQLKDVDYVVGDPSMIEVLREAGADKAEAVLAMMADDSENAFCVLAVRELGGTARTVAAVNDAHHLSRVKLVQPDVVIAPQVLGGELAAMLLSGEQVTLDFVLQRVFQQSKDEPANAKKKG